MNKERIEAILNGSFLGDYLMDEHITDIRWNGTDLRLQDNQKGYFRPDDQPTQEMVHRLTKQIADVMKKQLTNRSPILDTEIGFLRLNAVHESVSPDGRTMSIRISRPRLAVTSVDDLIASKNKDVKELLKVLVLGESNIILSGKTGVGKTELQKLLVGYMPNDVSINLLEDTRDSHIKTLYPEKDIMSWQTLLSDDLENQITMQDLIKASLRNNPDWIIPAETRGIEASDMLDGAKTDHSVISTLHATGAMNIVARLMPMIRQSPAYSNMSDLMLGKEIVSLLRFGIHMELKKDNGKITREIKEIAEFTDYTEQGVIGTYLYRERKDFNEKTKSYNAIEELNPLSKQSLERLKDKEIYHLLPDVFITGEKKEVV